MAGEVIVGYDGAEGSEKALATATELAKDLGAPLVLVFAYEPPHMVGMYGELEDHRRTIKEFAEKRTAEGLERATTAGVEAEVLLIEERPAEGLAGTAKEREARMVVVGSQGSALPFLGSVIGSVPHKLTQISEVPVLVVPTAE